ncbi:MAG: Flp pilus assembly protein CpaB [Phycisphaerales bacterium]|nr:Flp pilus assembly protein CpaB [Phycisphaerales bacterium]MCB9857950.1 Flp pilus assembly protein CpaB [Phycisphaerales bacterium]
MKPKTLIPLVVGLGVGFFAIKMGIDMVKKAKGSQEETFKVVVSAKSIEAAQRITEVMLTTRESSKSLMPRDGFMDVSSLVGRVTKMPVAPGVPITKAMLAPPGSEPGLAATIPAGYRAASVKVTEESAVAGFIMPSSRVDVYSAERDQDGKCRLILSDVEVGAVGQSMSQMGPDGKTAKVSKSVTLFLLPEQVQTLNAAMAQSRGNIRLAMRGHEDDPGESKLAGLFKKLMSAPTVSDEPTPAPTVAPVQVARAAPKQTYHVVDVRRGDEHQKLVFEENGTVRTFDGDKPLPPQFGGPAWTPTQGGPEPTVNEPELELPEE